MPLGLDGLPIMDVIPVLLHWFLDLILLPSVNTFLFIEFSITAFWVGFCVYQVFYTIIALWIVVSTEFCITSFWVVYLFTSFSTLSFLSELLYPFIEHSTTASVLMFTLYYCCFNVALAVYYYCCSAGSHVSWTRIWHNRSHDTIEVKHNNKDIISILVS